MKKAVDGLIIRESEVGESDKLLTLLTPDGKMFVRAKGVRSIKSKNLALCRIFNYGNFEFYEKNGYCWLSGGSIYSTFFGINTEIESVSLASYIAEVASEITGEGVEAGMILRTTLNVLYAIDKKLKPRDLIKGAYELFAATHSGFAPELFECRECGCESAESFFVDVMNGNIICPECLGSASSAERDALVDKYEARNILIPVSMSALTAARYVICARPERLLAFELKDAADLADFSRLGENYLQNHLERGFDTLDFYRAVSRPL